MDFFLRIFFLREFYRLIKLGKGGVNLLFDNDFDSILATMSRVFQRYDTNFPVPAVATCSVRSDKSIPSGAIKGHGGDGAEVSVRRNRFI
jgi:hypothetical protein